MRQIPLRLWLLAVLSAALQILPFPIAGPVPAWRTTVCWVALLPLLAALMGKDTRGRDINWKQGAALSYLCGVIWYLGNCYWIYATMHNYGGIAEPAAAGILFLFCLYLGLYHALFGGLVSALRGARWRGETIGVQGALLLSPFIWVAVELARARITGLPWDLLGIAQVDNPLLIKLAPFTGAYGISFVIAAVNALWLVRISMRERKHTRTALTAAGVAIIFLYVVFSRKLQPPIHEGTEAYATLVQQNIEVNTPQRESTGDMLRSFSQLSLFPPVGSRCNGIPELATTTCQGAISVQSGGVTGEAHYLLPMQLIVWPESPAIGFDEKSRVFRDAISKLAIEAHAAVIVGDNSIDADMSSEKGYSQYNSANFVTPDGKFAARYDKMHLVPFGEYTPYKKLFFFAGALLQDVGLFDPGKQRVVFSHDGHKYGTFICYESVFADEVRQFAKTGAEVLVNISNDGWYGDTSAAWEHLNMVRMRAIENHRWVLRSTNTGITAVIDPYGRVVIAAPRHIRTSLRVGFEYEHDVTFYAAHGDLFAYLCAVVTTLGLATYLIGPRSTKNT